MNYSVAEREDREGREDEQGNFRKYILKMNKGGSKYKEKEGSERDGKSRER